MKNKPTQDITSVFAFEVSVADVGWPKTINARKRSQAKAQYFRDLRDAWPDIPFTALRCRKLGRAHTSERFKQNALYRGLPSVECGQRVKVGASQGFIVGHNASANFDVLFDDDDARWAGLTLNVHPSELVLV